MGVVDGDDVGVGVLLPVCDAVVSAEPVPRDVCIVEADMRGDIDAD